MAPTIKIDFTDFWPGFNKHDNFFTRLLATRYNVQVVSDPDFLFHSVFGFEHLRYKCIRILYTGENIRPNFFESDYAFSFDFSDDTERNFRFPYYGWRVDPEMLVKKDQDLDAIMAEKTKFCNMVVSNASAKERIEFFHRLSKYKRVDSGGRHLNNVGGPVPDKMQFIKAYKFTLAFENSSYPGYTTEKITEPMLVDSLPVYWGNPLVGKDFNTRSFINVHDYRSFDEAIEAIIRIDQDEALYRSYLAQPHFINNEVNDFVKKENILNKLTEIFEHGKSHTQLTKQFKGIYLPLKKGINKAGKFRRRINRKFQG